MGLDIAEIAMDLEDEFNIHIDDDAIIGPRVRDMEDFVLAHIDKSQYHLPSRAQRMQQLAETLGEATTVDRALYAKLRRLIPELPTQILKVPDAFKSAADVTTLYQSLIDQNEIVCDEEQQITSDESIRLMVRKIIRRRLCLDSDPEPHQDLIRDLGAD